MTNRAGFYLRHKFNVTSALNAQICDSNGNRIPNASAFLFFLRKEKRKEYKRFKKFVNSSFHFVFVYSPLWWFSTRLCLLIKNNTTFPHLSRLTVMPCESPCHQTRTMNNVCYFYLIPQSGEPETIRTRISIYI